VLQALCNRNREKLGISRNPATQEQAIGLHQPLRQTFKRHHRANRTNAAF
jgi:hypothetical protein